jgi:hypothetical protein
MLSLIVLLAVAVAYEAIQALNRFATLTTDDISKAKKRTSDPPTRLTTPLLL